MLSIRIGNFVISSVLCVDLGLTSLSKLAELIRSGLGMWLYRFMNTVNFTINCLRAHT